MWDVISQVGIGILTALGVFLVSRRNINRWGYVLGLSGQPFWFITSVVNRQWGVLFVTVLCTVSWANGVREWFPAVHRVFQKIRRGTLQYYFRGS